MDNKYCENNICVESCRNDDDCESGSYRNKCIDKDDGVCIEELCRVDEECSGSDLCYNEECISDDSTLCVDNDDCEMDEYCDNEVEICKNNNLSKSRRETKVIPLIMCSWNGLITLFVMASSYLAAQKLAPVLLNKECEMRCALRSSLPKTTNVNVKSSDCEVEKKFESFCTGNCKDNVYLLELEQITLSEEICPKITYSAVVTTAGVDEHKKESRQIFDKMLGRKCGRETVGKFFPSPLSNNPDDDKIQKSFKFCEQDYDSIECTQK